ncbi:MAG: hypothetical protein AB8G96_15605 [Phycisphaerales bacterium]
MHPIVGIAIFAAAVGVIVWIGVMFDKRRQRELTDAAADLGLDFEADGTASLAIYDDFACLNQRRRRPARNRMFGQIADIEVHCFEARHRVQAGKNSHTITETVVAATLPHRAWPTFRLEREGIGSRLRQVFGAADLDFDDDPAFSKAWHLSADDEAAIRAWFTPARREAIGTPAGNIIEARDRRVVIKRHRSRVRPRDLAGHILDSVDLINRMGSA